MQLSRGELQLGWFKYIVLVFFLSLLTFTSSTLQRPLTLTHIIIIMAAQRISSFVSQLTPGQKPLDKM
jgi:hypothetical protein